MFKAKANDFGSLAFLANDELQVTTGGKRIPNAGGGGIGFTFKISDLPGPKGPTYHSGPRKSRRAGRHYAIN
ncbi:MULTISPECIES: hypothetical protein [Lacticaseibacillus]|uniref:Uncharacterized protein n=2 Tax=Lacticaseibacillus TaxID=2759736 RepID=A0ABY9L399_9LACO|nr:MULTISPECIES: hypothetical protein [Lacticaseibacillus]OFR98438.1 hypothetical protein HMPREF2861_06345 [Lactobacillus sp. HMSC068F07]MDE3281148.1 hypothetical protein [Lacticaseibacillus casei]MDE3316870.1 hypothetical protein [Lacticaseibacillus zeae]WLV78077.1 hypothetical protein LACPH_000020 [Lacticaseibacillus sp. NCIMB 15471]WLV83654.1 hypothetical protein LACZS2_000034 [Lacticaseibacillus sp. NCIMB 15475]